VDLDVNNPAAFASDPAAQLGVAVGIARTAGVRPSMVTVSCKTTTPGVVQCGYTIAIPANPATGTSSPSAVAGALVGDRPSGIDAPFLDSLGSAIAAAIGSSNPNLQGVLVQDVNYPGDTSAPVSTTSVPSAAASSPASQILGSVDLYVANGPAFASSPDAQLAVQQGIAKTMGVDPSMVAATCSSSGATNVQCSYTVSIPANSPSTVASPSVAASTMFGNQATGTNVPLLNSLAAAISSGINASDPNLQLASVNGVNYPQTSPNGTPAAQIKGTMDVLVASGAGFSSSPSALQGVQDGIAKTVV